jgi:L-threonylcarbamoyladenylate synthase
MTETVSIGRDGADRARAALERRVGSGGIVIFPADTVYGLACDPLAADAVARVNELKRRPPGKPSAVMYFAPLAMRELLGGMGPETRRALAALLPGPVTVVVANPERRYPLACGDDPERLGLRLIEGPLSGARCAVLQTSANPAREPPPRSLDAVEDDLLAATDLAIDGGELPGTASTVVDLSGIESGAGWSILREGELPSSELERLLS